MRIGCKTTITSVVLTLLLVALRPVYGGSVSSAGVSPAPGAVSVAPSAGARAANAAPMAPAPPMAGVSPLVLPNARTTGARGTLPVLVIPAQEMDPAASSRIAEDLSVMSRIIEKSVRDLRSDASGFVTAGDRVYGALFLPSDGFGPRVLRASGAHPKAIYIGGYGALFSLQVDFPLVPPPETSEPNKTAEKGDSVWAAAQRELTSPQTTSPVRTGMTPSRPYQPEAVENLRSTLIGLLKHATNIRGLEPESWLTILVQGPTAVQDQTGVAASNDPFTGIVGARPVGRTLLTLRAKKADIDLFAKGQLDSTQFQQRVQIVAN